MVLRESAKSESYDVDLAGLVDSKKPIGVPQGEALLQFADALIGSATEGDLEEARRRVAAEVSPEGLVSAAIIAANFSKNDRIANALGIPLEEQFIRDSEDFREQLGINSFPSARNSLKN